jgi:hypothetical protein
MKFEAHDNLTLVGNHLNPEQKSYFDIKKRKVKNINRKAPYRYGNYRT